MNSDLLDVMENDLILDDIIEGMHAYVAVHMLVPGACMCVHPSCACICMFFCLHASVAVVIMGRSFSVCVCVCVCVESCIYWFRH